jgi:hypothetical protein
MLRIILSIAVSALFAFAQDEAAKQKLLGNHMLSLQWIHYDTKAFGSAKVTESAGALKLIGEQRNSKNGDYLKIDGQITDVSKLEFRFKGSIVYRSAAISGDRLCERNGEFTFKITGTRKYWRLQQMDSPCGTVTDYVDLFF